MHTEDKNSEGINTQTRSNVRAVWPLFFFEILIQISFVSVAPFAICRISSRKTSSITGIALKNLWYLLSGLFFFCKTRVWSINTFLWRSQESPVLKKSITFITCVHITLLQEMSLSLLLKVKKILQYGIFSWLCVYKQKESSSFLLWPRQTSNCNRYLSLCYTSWAESPSCT